MAWISFDQLGWYFKSRIEDSSPRSTSHWLYGKLIACYNLANLYCVDFKFKVVLDIFFLMLYFISLAKESTSRTCHPRVQTIVLPLGQRMLA